MHYRSAQQFARVSNFYCASHRLVSPNASAVLVVEPIAIYPEFELGVPRRMNAMMLSRAAAAQIIVIKVPGMKLT